MFLFMKRDVCTIYVFTCDLFEGGSGPGSAMLTACTTSQYEAQLALGADTCSPGQRQ